MALLRWGVCAVALCGCGPAPPAPEATPMSFDEALAATLQHEGGWYDGSGSHDPNPTYKGVTQRTYNGYRQRRLLPQRSVREMTDHELRDIYRGYWLAVKGDHLGALTAQTVFDHAVNAGPVAAIRLLQTALGVTVDGVLGPKTLAAVRAQDDAALAARVTVERVQFYCDLSRAPKHRPSLLSWVSRTLPLHRTASQQCLDKLRDRV